MMVEFNRYHEVFLRSLACFVNKADQDLGDRYKAGQSQARSGIAVLALVANVLHVHVATLRNHILVNHQHTTMR